MKRTKRILEFCFAVLLFTNGIFKGTILGPNSPFIVEFRTFKNLKEKFYITIDLELLIWNWSGFFMYRICIPMDKITQESTN